MRTHHQRGGEQFNKVSFPQGQFGRKCVTAHQNVGELKYVSQKHRRENTGWNRLKTYKNIRDKVHSYFGGSSSGWETGTKEQKDDDYQISLPV
jgi:hypothetical protein